MELTGTLTTLFRHHLWANRRLLAACSGLTDEQLDAAVVGTYGSIRDTLTHIARAEQSYFSRISTGQRYQHSNTEETMSLANIAAALKMTGSGLIEWAPMVAADDTVTIDWDGTPREVPKTILLTQAINHATEHRAQVMVMLTQLGIQPPELDSWNYFDEQV